MQEIERNCKMENKITIMNFIGPIILLIIIVFPLFAVAYLYHAWNGFDLVIGTIAMIILVLRFIYDCIWMFGKVY